MKQIVLLIIMSIVVFSSCKKDEVNEPEDSYYYQSTGNLLILKVGDDFESAYEYNLASTELKNDSLQLFAIKDTSNIENMTYYKYSPNADTLFCYFDNSLIFNSSEICNNKLNKFNSSIPFNIHLIQIIAANNSDLPLIWSKVSNLQIVKNYRVAQPTSKIGLKRVVLQEYDEEQSLSFPVEKHLLFLVK